MLGTSFAGSASADIGGFVAIMNGANEVPGPGDPDGFGVATVMLDSDTGEVCVRLRVYNIRPATAAHIHVGGPTVAGPVVVPLPAPTSGSSSGCVLVTRSVVQRIIDNPGNHYVNVHNAQFPAGAVRGQLR